MPRWAVARGAGPPNISAKLKNANIPYQSVWIEGVVSTSLLGARLGYKYQLLPSFVPQIRIRPTQPQAAATLLACFACNYPQLLALACVSVMANNKLPALPLAAVLLALAASSLAGDPDMLQDICVADYKSLNGRK